MENKLNRYNFFTMGPWQSPEEQGEIEAAYNAAVEAGERRIALEWSWCGGSNIMHAVDGRGREWRSDNGRRYKIK